MEGYYDYDQWIANGAQRDHLVTIAEGAAYCGLDEQFTYETQRIGNLGRTYNAVDVDRIDNSNATVYTILDEMGLPRVKPNFSAPGWGTNLHEETTVTEEIGETLNDAGEAIEDAYERSTEGIRREWNWFNGLSPQQQLQQLNRLFR